MTFTPAPQKIIPLEQGLKLERIADRIVLWFCSASEDHSIRTRIETRFAGVALR